MMSAAFIRSFLNNGIVLLLVTTFFWSGNAVAGKLANGEVSPMLLTLLRWWISFLFLLPIAYPKVRQDWPVIRKNWLYFIALAPLGFTGFNLFLYIALTYTTALNVTIQQAAMPLFIFLINFLFFRTRPFGVQILGYTLTLIGVLLTVGGGSLERLLSLRLNIGDIIMLGGTISYSIYSVGLRAKPVMHWLSFLCTLIFIAAVTAIPFAIYESSTEKFVFPATWLASGIVLYASIFPSIVCQACFIRGVELLGANNAALFLNLVPIFGALLAVLILGESFYVYHSVALALVLGGIYIAQRMMPKEAQTKEP